MYINIVFSDRIPHSWVKRKSKKFFQETDYIHRNGVFVHPDVDSVFALKKNTIHIRMPDSDKTSQDFASQYLQSVFGTNMIGISGLNEENATNFNSVNFVSI